MCGVSSVSVCVCMFVYRMDVEGVRADEGDGFLQLVVLHAVLIVLKRHHGERERTHGALTAIGQLHFQRHGVAHLTLGDRVTVTRFTVHFYICAGVGGWEMTKRCD